MVPIVAPSVPKQNGKSGSVEERMALVNPKMAYRHVLLPSSHGVITFAVDVMAQVKARRALLASERKLRTVVEPVYDDEYPDVQIGNSVTTYSDMYDLDGNYLDTSRANSGVYYFHDENIEWPDGVEKRLSDAFASPEPARDPYM